MMKSKLAILGLLLLMLLTLVCCDFLKDYEKSTVYLEPGDVDTLNISATFGNRIEGYFTVEGGGSVTFWARSPSGLLAHDTVVAVDRFDFLINCYEGGYYKLYFSIPTSFTERNIYIRYRLR